MIPGRFPLSVLVEPSRVELPEEGLFNDFHPFLKQVAFYDHATETLVTLMQDEMVTQPAKLAKPAKRAKMSTSPERFCNPNLIWDTYVKAGLGEMRH